MTLLVNKFNKVFQIHKNKNFLRGKKSTRYSFVLNYSDLNNAYFKPQIGYCHFRQNIKFLLI